MIGYFCDWCGKPYKPYPVKEYGNTLASVMRSKSENADAKEIPIGTKIVGEGWTSLDSSHVVQKAVAREICPDCYEAFLDFVNKRKEKTDDQA